MNEDPEFQRLDLLVDTDPLALRDEAFRLLTQIRRVDQKYGPFDEFRQWREAGDQ